MMADSSLALGRRGAALAILLAAAGGCRAARPDGSAPPACGASLSGTWHDAEQPDYRYRVDDAGARVVARPVSADGAPSAGARVDVELARGPQGLAGVTRQTGEFTFPDGERRTCTVEFVTRVLSCQPGRLELEVEQSGGVMPDCRRVEESAPDLAHHLWVRE